MYKTPLNIGTIAGLLAFVLFLVLYYVGISPIGMGQFMGFWIPVLAILWAGFKVRKDVLGGNMTWSQGLGVGLLTIFIWSTCKGACMYLFMTFFENHVLEQYFEFLESYAKVYDSITGQDFIKKFDVPKLKKELNPIQVALNSISSNLTYGGLLSIGAAFILKRQR